MSLLLSLIYHDLRHVYVKINVLYSCWAGLFWAFSLSLWVCPDVHFYVYICVYKCELKNGLHNILSISLPPPPLPCLSILTLSSNHPSGRNLVSKYEELMWSSPLLGLMSFWLCPSSRCSTVRQSWCYAYRWALG